jgi:hypothetical protein
MSGIVQHPANLGLPYEGGGCPGACVTGPWPFARTRRLRYITPPVVALWKFASAASAATSDGNSNSSVAENELGDLSVRSPDRCVNLKAGVSRDREAMRS